MQSILTKKQTKTLSKVIQYDGKPRLFEVNLRYDDQCNNGHNTFAITGDLHVNAKPTNGQRQNPIMCGCLHSEIKKYFPELSQLIKWHLVSSDGPLHYIANTVYHASDRDFNGMRKGEPFRYKTLVKVGNSPILHKLPAKLVEHIQETEKQGFIVSPVPVEYDNKPGDNAFSPKYTFTGFDVDRWYLSPFDDLGEAEQWCEAINKHNKAKASGKAGFIKFVKVATDWGKGKEPDLDAARSCAIWPDASLEQLQDKELLEKRLPALLAEFKSAIESLGFTY